MLSALRKYVDYGSPIFGFFGFLSPDTWSFLTFLAGIAAGWYYYQGNFVMGGLFVLVSGITDTIDGGVARKLGRRTKFGGILDATMDRLSEGIVYVGLLKHYGVAAFALIFSYLVSYVRAKDDRVKTGIAERTDRGAVLILASLLGFVGVGLWIITVAAAITVLMRLAEARKLNP
jgi:archaetidylinositol phosphate synthase